MTELGLKIKSLRVERGWTQEMLGKLLRKSPQTISCYELGRQSPPADVLRSLSSVFHISIDELVENERGETLSIKDFNVEQQKVIKLIFDEFDKPTGCGGELSANQIRIVQKLFLIFMKSGT